MVDRKKIALTFSYSENWIAGSYYVANIIKALNSLEDIKKPHLTILMHSLDGIGLLEEIEYPYIKFIELSLNNKLISRYYQRAKKIMFGFDDLQKKLANVEHIFEGGEKYQFIKNQYYWVHDFQELRMPKFFSEKDAAERSALPRKVARINNATLILSSYDAFNDFKTFFPDYQCKVKVLRFASSIPDFSNVDFDAQCKLFDISQPYFICSNQFWQHKNHEVVLKAIKILQEKNSGFQVVFTGKNFDHRNPEYFNNLKKFVTENHLESYVRFLGFIDREVQLSLAKNSISYVQPSLFEGWSTTVEDAKCLNKFVILSNISVHREQLNYNALFFDPHKSEDLADKMEIVLTKRNVVEKRNYAENIRNFGEDLLEVFS